MATNALELPEICDQLVRLMAEGGDERIAPDPASGLNRYLCAPRPSDVLAFSSTTANDLSSDALVHLCRLPLPSGSPADYSAKLEQFRRRIRSAYELAADTTIVFAPSGTDLEFVALACTPGAGRKRLMNILLGADEVGSGCIHSANGRHFANRTALGLHTTPGAPVDQLAGTGITVVDIRVRDDAGRPRESGEIADAIDDSVRVARAMKQHVLAHVVHVSKTGLIVPSLGDIDRLRAKWGDAITWVVDACQARIDPPAIAGYLKRGAIVLLTGSKYMGAPPFCGFALVPPMLSAGADPLQPGMRSIFRRSEWPAGWPGAETLVEGANPGLLLRLEAALFELERYRTLSSGRITAIVEAFGGAVRRMADRLRIGLIPAATSSRTNTPPESRTLFALDLSRLVEDADFHDAQRWHRMLAEHGIRLGQPVRSSKLNDGRWTPTMRLALSMPMIADHARDIPNAAARFDRELALVAGSLVNCARAFPRTAQRSPGVPAH